MVNEEALPWLSSNIALLSESGSSRPRMEADVLQGRQGGEAVLSGSAGRGGRSWGCLGKQPSLRAAPSRFQFLERKGTGASPEGV